MSVTTPHHIIVAGGDDAMHVVLRFLLEEDGCMVHTLTACPLPSPTLREDAAVVAIVDHATADAVFASLRPWPQPRPLLVLARGTNRALRQRAFALGAVDIIGLPAAPSELQARLRAALGYEERTHSQSHDHKPVRAGGLVLQPATRAVGDNAGWQVTLTRRETALLAEVMRRPGRVVGRHELLDQVWSEAYEGSDNTLEVCVRRLRAKLARPDRPQALLHTARGQGYLFEARATPRPSTHPQPPRESV